MIHLNNLCQKLKVLVLNEMIYVSRVPDILLFPFFLRGNSLHFWMPGISKSESKILTYECNFCWTNNNLKMRSFVPGRDLHKGTEKINIEYKQHSHVVSSYFLNVDHIILTLLITSCLLKRLNVPAGTQNKMLRIIKMKLITLTALSIITQQWMGVYICI